VSERPADSSAFELLAEPIRRWVWQQDWRELRDIQERAIGPILEGRSVVLASTTASGKTEAAFLPLLSRISDSHGLRILCVSPLKALINDQSRRLEGLARAVDLQVTPWHGDIAATRKRSLREDPSGVLLITPESLEAMFVLRGSSIAEMFAGLEYIVIDELHSFIATERGRQLQSLLRRIELAIGRGLPRIGLSATLGDLDLAAQFLRPAGEVLVIESHAQRRDVQLQIRGYLEPFRDDDRLDRLQTRLSEDLYAITRGGTHIVFANRRADVELYTSLLTELAEKEHVPNECWPHHGSLAKDVREEAEAALRSERPATVIATTTLELGIDVGSVDTIAQIGAPTAVASMRQRLGRSGRRPGDPSVLRMFVDEPEHTGDVAPQDELRGTLVQSIAMVELLIERFNEAPREGALHLSTLVQQILSLIAQRGGVRAQDAWKALCEEGPFTNVTQEMFAQLLRDLAAREMLAQSHDGTIVLAVEGERMVNHYDFYSAFLTFDEYRLVVGSRTLGTLPVSRPLAVGDLLLFAGHRWSVLEVRDTERIISLEPAPAGRAPSFIGGAALIDDAVRSRMRAVYNSSSEIAYLDSGAKRLLTEGRRAFRRLGLHQTPVLAWGETILLFPWTGDRALDTLALMLRSEGFRDTARDGSTVLVPHGTAEDVREALVRLIEAPPIDTEIASSVANKRFEKHHDLLGEELLTLDYASSRLDLPRALEAARILIGDGPSGQAR
jgi:ATP-dependent Lhr-like helicase